MLDPPINACYHLHDMHHYQHYAEQLLAILPDNPDLLFGLAGSWDANGR